MSDIPLSRLSAFQVDRALHVTAPHWRPVLLAMKAGRCAFAGIMQNAEPFTISCNRPTILLLGDDLYEARGPTAFHARSVRRFVERCGLAVVVACSPEPELYAAAVAEALLKRTDVVIVETRSEHEADWILRLQKIKPRMPLMLGTVRSPSRAKH